MARRRRSRAISGIFMTTITLGILIMMGIGIFTVVNLNTYVGSNSEDIIEESDSAVIKDEEVVTKLDNSGYLSLKEDPNAEDAINVQNMLNTWNYQREDGKKVAYLTFDDGPSETVTGQVLDVLKANDVKATFFVLGSMVEKSDVAKNNLKRMANEGHSIGNHGYCHRYEILYPGRVANTAVFMDDMKKSENVMKSVLGKDFHTRVIRMPGGHSSWNTDELEIVLENEGYAYIDWNSLNGDAEGHGLSAEHLINRLKETVDDLYGNDDSLVILMHDIDAKASTATALQGIIDFLKAKGYVFKTLK